MGSTVVGSAANRYSLFQERFLLNLARLRKTMAEIFRKKLALTGLIIIVIFVLMALLAPLLVGPYQSSLQFTKPDQPPSSQHPLGTDESGKDILNLLVYGSQVSVLVGFAASFVAMVAGTALGLIGGYYGKVTDQLISRATDFFLVIPWLPFVLVLVAVLGPSLQTIIFAIALVSWPTTARVIRSQVLSLKERQFIERARAVGAGNAYILTKHILPNVMPLVWAESVLTVSSAVFTEAFLSFFGLGWSGNGAIESWGQMVNNAYNQLAILRGQWWYFLPPGAFITLLVLGFAMLGYGIEEIMNPALKRRGRAAAKKKTRASPAP